MTGIAGAMREVHRLRRYARDLQEQLDRIPRQLTAQQARVAKEDAALKETQDAIKRFKVTAHEREVTLKTTLNKLERHAKQLQEAAAPKEYDALQKEIATEKAEAAKLEDEILTAITEAEELTAKLPALEAAVQIARQDYSNYETSIAERQAGLNAQLAEAGVQLKQAEAQIPEKHRSQYNRLVASMGAEALAAVQGRSCGSCYTEITAQSYHDLQQGRYINCKSCYRILYLPE